MFSMITFIFQHNLDPFSKAFLQFLYVVIPFQFQSPLTVAWRLLVKLFYQLLGSQQVTSSHSVLLCRKLRSEGWMCYNVATLFYFSPEAPNIIQSRSTTIMKLIQIHGGLQQQYQHEVTARALKIETNTNFRALVTGWKTMFFTYTLTYSLRQTEKHFTSSVTAPTSDKGLHTLAPFSVRMILHCLKNVEVRVLGSIYFTICCN